MPLQVGIEEGSRSTAVCVSGLQYCQYSQKKISLITLLSDLVALLSLWAVRPVQSLNACTRVHFTLSIVTYLPPKPSVTNIYRSTREVRAEARIVLHVNF